MTERVRELLDILKSKEYRTRRVKTEFICSVTPDDILGKAELFCETLKKEKPVYIKNDRIGFYRCNTNRGIHSNRISPENTIPCYDMILSEGFGGIYKRLSEAKRKGLGNIDFINAAMLSIDGVFDLCERYRESATGELKSALENVPYNPPRSYHEALVMIKIILFTLRLNTVILLPLGRFDKYMYPYFKSDIDRGVSREELLSLTEEFFISINFDTDLFYGVQQGDNGQSLVLGGLNTDGSDSFNELSEVCMQASAELELIDPKINLRVHKNTPMSLYESGTQMTKQGLGFPQYCNDDVVIPGLIELGYKKEDAYNYGVAACWEYIVPNNFDFPNIGTFNFPKAVNEALYSDIEKAEDFEGFMKSVEDKIKHQANELMQGANERKYYPNAYYSLFYKDCVEQCVDYTENKRDYKNHGFHGAGIANAVNALSAVKTMVFDKGEISRGELLTALDRNFEGFTSLRNKLLSCPQMGNNDEIADILACRLMDMFCNALKGKRNIHGGIYRPGTGSAMDYIFAARKVSATADGRYAFEPFGSSYSPSLSSRTQGVLSVVQSFTKFDMKRIINGGPLTLEIHDNTFRNEMGIKKVAQLVQMFILLGGHQLQLNSINREKLLDAQKNPEKYPNLIVRVWGWSGYFNELDLEYQNHIIARTEYAL